MLTREDSALAEVRRRHEIRVLESLVTHGSRTRKDLESDTKLSRTTLSAIVGELRQRGVLSENDQEIYGTGRNGRPTKVLTLNPNAGAAVGVELGRRRISVSVKGYDGATLNSEQRSLADNLGMAEKVTQAAALLAEMVQEGRITPATLLGVGVGIASRHADPRSLADGGERQLDPQGATLDPLREVLGVPLLWDNNIRLAAMTQALAPGNTSENLLYMVLSAGISSAVVVNGSLLRGGNGIAGEIGHISVDFDGPQCWCGRRGCLERLLNETNVLQEAGQRGQAFESIEAIAGAVEAGNSVACEVVDWAGGLLARAVVSACVLLDPNRVVVAGELSQFGERLLAPARQALAEQHLDIGPRTTSIDMASYVPTAGSDGAALMALRHWRA
ncbi:ROK family protein [Arthrobacter sp. GMC3]|uniref:ROK family protein n=1 Tax=Arthrobacter sp. GMC3 TaxID=2058894 RepID=UPI000CE33236|nr:ROK family protein [Arthrobacter sp. GMC3]